MEYDSALTEMDSIAVDFETSYNRINDSLNTVYYIYGSEKDLIKKEILIKNSDEWEHYDGKYIRNPQLKLDNFKKTTRTKNDLLRISGKFNQMIPPKADGSYSDKKFHKDSCYIEITNCQKFWRTEKYVLWKLRSVTECCSASMAALKSRSTVKNYW